MAKSKKNDVKKLEKSAEKAFDKAKDALDDAKKAAKKLAKNKRPAVGELKDDLKKVKKSLEAKGDAKQTEAKPGTVPGAAKESPATKAPATKAPAAKAPAAAIYSPPVPEVEVVAPGVTEDLHAQTLIALRTLAKSKGLTNYTRLPKAALIEKIELA